MTQHPQLTIDGREEARTAPSAPESHEQPCMFEFPTSLAGSLALDTDTAPAHEPMCTAPVRRRGEWS